MKLNFIIIAIKNKLKIFVSFLLFKNDSFWFESVILILPSHYIYTTIVVTIVYLPRLVIFILHTYLLWTIQRNVWYNIHIVNMHTLSFNAICQYHYPQHTKTTSVVILISMTSYVHNFPFLLASYYIVKNKIFFCVLTFLYFPSFFLSTD